MKKTVLITGANGGLGLSLVKLFLKNDFTVFATDIRLERLEALPPNESLQLFHLNITIPAEAKTVLEKISTVTDRLDLLINNAGVIDFYPLSENDPEKTLEIIKINAWGSLVMVHECLPLLINAKGRVMQISSESVKVPGAFQPYQIGKISVEAIMRSLRQELALKEIKTILVRPGAIKTPLLEHVHHIKNPINNSVMNFAFQQFSRLAENFVGHIAQPDEVAAFIYKVSVRSSPALVYHFNNNPLLTFLSYLPERWSDALAIQQLKKRPA